MRRLTILALLLVACGGDAKPSIASTATVIAPPDSALVWGNEVAMCLGRGGLPPTQWFTAPLDQESDPLGGVADNDLGRITLRSDWQTWPVAEQRRVIKHELAHRIGGWKANHPPVHPLGTVDRSEPRAYFNARCGTL